MGMVPFYLKNKYRENIKFQDIRGLATRHFTDCPVTEKVPKGRGGLALSYDYIFDNSALLVQHCKVQFPDIIYDLDKLNRRKKTMKRTDILNNNGYIIVYKIQGITSPIYNKRIIRANQFIAVKKDLLKNIPTYSVREETWLHSNSK